MWSVAGNYAGCSECCVGNGESKRNLLFLGIFDRFVNVASFLLMARHFVIREKRRLRIIYVTSIYIHSSACLGSVRFVKGVKLLVFPAMIETL